MNKWDKKLEKLLQDALKDGFEFVQGIQIEHAGGKAIQRIYMKFHKKENAKS